MLALRSSLRSIRASPQLAAAGPVRHASNSHMHDGDAKTIQKEKEKAMKGEKSDQGTPGWNETIASESEAKVKAQKNPKGPEELQAETAKIKESEHAHGAEPAESGTPPKNL